MVLKATSMNFPASPHYKIKFLINPHSTVFFTLDLPKSIYKY